MTFLNKGEYSSITSLLTVCLTFIIISTNKLKINSLDILIILFIAYQIISCIFSNYPIYLWYLGIKAQVIPICFYFVGRSNFFLENKL